MRFNPSLEMSIEQGIELYENKAEIARKELIVKGFISPGAPSYNTKSGLQPYRGELPDLTSLSDNQLGVYMSLLSEWNHYTQYQLAESNTQLEKAKAILEHVEAKLRIAYQRDEEGKKRSNPERDDYVRSDKRYIEAQSNVIYWETMYTYIRAIANAAEGAFSAVSRRITQRGQEIDRSNRTGSVSNQTHGGPLFGKKS
jgi:hypothetical protein